VDLEVDGDRPELLAARDDHVVEGVGALPVDHQREHRALVAPELTGQVWVEVRLDLVGVQLGQEAERPHPDRHDRQARGTRPARGPQRRAVSAE
jgi:hypothetical protein